MKPPIISTRRIGRLEVYLLATFTLTYAKLLEKFTIIPILNEQNEPVCVLQKVERSSIGKLFNIGLLLTTQQALPIHFETCTTLGIPLFRVTPTLLTKGMSHQLILPDETVIPIQRKTVQLLESSYSFTMDGLIFLFEQDFTSTAYLYCNDQKIASAKLVENELVKQSIIFNLLESEDILFIALLAALYQSLFALSK